MFVKIWGNLFVVFIISLCLHVCPMPALISKSQASADGKLQIGSKQLSKSIISFFWKERVRFDSYSRSWPTSPWDCKRNVSLRLHPRSNIPAAYTVLCFTRTALCGLPSDLLVPLLLAFLPGFFCMRASRFLPFILTFIILKHLLANYLPAFSSVVT